MNETQLTELAKAMEDLAEMRKANRSDLHYNVMSATRQALRAANCMAVSGPLLSALKSAQITRKQIRKRTYRGEPGDVWMSIKLPQTSEATDSSAKPPPATVSIHVSWIVEAHAGDHANESTWEIELNSKSKGRSLVYIYQMELPGGGGIDDSDYKTAGIVKFMRQSGLMGEGASLRQQSELALCAISALLKIAGAKAPDGGRYMESCEAAVYNQQGTRPNKMKRSAAKSSVETQNELPEPPLSVEEQEDERKRQEQEALYEAMEAERLKGYMENNFEDEELDEELEEDDDEEQ